MIAVALDTLIAYLLSKKKLSTFQYLIYGFISAVFISAATSAISSSSLDENSGIYFIKVLTGTVLNIFLIYVLHYFFIRRQRIKKAIDKLHVEDQYWEQNEREFLLKTLEKYKHVNYQGAPVNSELEFSLSQLSTENIINRLETNNFAKESIPSALRTLSSRL
jgi:hypothetical protein